MKINRILLVLLLLQVFIAASATPAQTDTLRVGCEPDYPPFCFVDEQGQPQGLAVDVMREVARASGLEVSFQVGIWNVIKQDLASGKLDVLPFVGRTPEREDLFDFTLPYLSLHGAIFIRKNNTDIRSLEDLKDKHLVVMKGDNAEEFIRREKLSDEVTTTATFEEAFHLVSQGEYDATISQRITGIRLIDELNLKNVVGLDLPLHEFRQDFCIAVREGDQQLLTALEEGLSVIIAHDTFNEIRLKWLGARPSEGFSIGQIIRVLAPATAGFLILLALFFIIFLRSQVKKRTRRLNQEVTEHRKTLEQLDKEQGKLTESESWMRLLLDSTAEGIFAIDRQGLCTMINHSALRMLGYDSDRELVGKHMHQTIHHQYPNGSHMPREECLIEKAIHESGGAHSADEVLFRKDGSPFSCELFSYPIRMGEDVIGSVVTFWDISERIKNQEELLHLKNDLARQVEERTAELAKKVETLNRSQKAMLFMVEDLNRITADLKDQRAKLETANQDLEAFTYTVSHDLRAPLRAINGFSSFLVEDYAEQLDAEGRRYVETIRNNATKMDQLILDLLNLSRISRATVRKTQTDMTHLVRQCYQEVATDEQKSDFSFELEKLAPVQGDPVLLKQVWVNLISNALKYSEKSAEKRIVIRSELKEKQIQYSIQDYGAGFNPAYADKLFGIFQRLHRESEFEGVGVGLAIVKRIIARHGGSVGAEGQENQGAKFFFTLPNLYI